MSRSRSGGAQEHGQENEPLLHTAGLWRNGDQKTLLSVILTFRTQFGAQAANRHSRSAFRDGLLRWTLLST